MATQRTTSFLAILVVSCLASACGDAPAPAAAPPEVSVAQVVSVTAPQWDEFTGRFSAIDAVDLRPRVSGYIQRVAYEEGQEVAVGQILFAIDPSSYQAELDRAVADLERARSKASLATSESERARKLAEQQVISTEMYEQRSAAMRQAQSEIRASQAAVDLARLNLGYTQVRAPVSGRAGKALVTVGNLAQGNDTVLVNIVSLDPMHVYFEGDEGTYLRYVNSIRSGEQLSPRNTRTPVRIGLTNEEGFPHTGYVDFVDNRVDEGTGTIRARAVVENKDGRFTPGLYARVQMMASEPRDMLLVDEKAIVTDQDRKYVYVLAGDKTVQRRDIQLGPKQDGLRIVRSGLQRSDRVVVNGLQKIMGSGTAVTPLVIPMIPPDTSTKAL